MSIASLVSITRCDQYFAFFAERLDAAFRAWCAALACE
jgi:hypothetical protein